MSIRDYDQDTYMSPENNNKTGGNMKAPVSSGKEFPLIDPGTYQAVCYAVVDLGTHKDEWQGNPIDRHLCVITFEIPSERIDIEKDGKTESKPRAISLKLTFSMGDKANLRKHMESWRGQPYTDIEAADVEFKAMIGVNGLLQIAHRTSQDGSKTYGFIQTVTSLMKEMKQLKSENPSLFFEFEKPFVDEKGIHFPENMPEWISNKIKESAEYNDILDNADLPESNEPEKDSVPPKEAIEEDDLPF